MIFWNYELVPLRALLAIFNKIPKLQIVVKKETTIFRSYFCLYFPDNLALLNGTAAILKQQKCCYEIFGTSTVSQRTGNLECYWMPAENFFL